jgi:ferredoxin-type protein NapH
MAVPSRGSPRNWFTTAMKILKTILLTLPITAVTALFLLHGQSLSTLAGLSSLAVYLYLNYLFFMMLYTNRTWKYRAMLFIPAAVLFPIEFIYTNFYGSTWGPAFFSSPSSW